jgi:hypothetical protein
LVHLQHRRDLLYCGPRPPRMAMRAVRFPCADLRGRARPVNDKSLAG